jgi:hypothetical protein
VDDLRLLKVGVDESIHACLWAIDNNYVYDMSTAIAEFLYKIGFRLEKRKENKQNKTVKKAKK